jgi:hypothetical protein
MFEFGPVQHRLSIVQTAQAGVLKISVGDEKRGLVLNEFCINQTIKLK